MMNKLNSIISQEHKHLESRHDEVKIAYASHERSELILHYKDRTTLHDGLLSMWNWALRQPQRFEWQSYEISKGMYSFWKR